MPSRLRSQKAQPSLSQAWATSKAVNASKEITGNPPEKPKRKDDDTESTTTNNSNLSKPIKNNTSKPTETDNSNDRSDSGSEDSSDDDLAALAAKQRPKNIHFDEVNIAETSTPSKKSKPNNNHSGTINNNLLPMNTFKPVDHMSTNRRECNRLSDQNDSENPTPGANTTQDEYLHHFKTRISVKVNVPPSDTPETALMHRIKEFIRELKEADESIVIFPWKAKDYGKCAIDKADDVPSDLRKFKIFTKKIWAAKPDVAATTYFQLWVGHDFDIKDIRFNMQDWLRQGQHGVYVDMLQADDSVDVGWLLYSTQTMDAGALADEIMEVIKPDKIGLRWKKIETGSNKKVSASKVVKALNVEGSMRQKASILHKLHQYLGSTNKPIEQYPNQIRLRFVKNKADTVNPTEKSKIDKLRDRQKLFTRDILTSTTFDIIQLDYARQRNNPTLRQMIMSIKSKSHPNTPLFHSVDLDWKGEGYAFQFSPDMGEEAACITYTLLPYLEHFYPDADVKTYFDESTISRCATMKFCPEQGEVIDTSVSGSAYQIDFGEDDELGGFSFRNENGDKDDDEEIERVTRPSKTNKEPTPRPNHFPSDSDSVSTFGGNGRLGRAAGFNPSPNQIRDTSLQNDNASISSSISGVTMRTIQTLESKFEQRFENFDTKFVSMMNLLEKALVQNKESPSNEVPGIRVSESSPGNKW